MICLTKIFDFSASHRLHRDEWSEAKNLEVFGKCANPNGHGHNYRLHVTVTGTLDPETNMILDASKLSDIVEEFVVHDVDHKNLNIDVTWLQTSIPTCEAIIDAMWNRLEPEIGKVAPNAMLYELRLHETKRIYAVRRRTP